MAWQRIERRGWRGQVLDYVEVAACAGCRRGIDRDFRTEYRVINGRVYCVDCAKPTQLPLRSAALVQRG